ncbi:MAG: arginase [Gammaproteobacteria bacterium]|nr:arginase [Gammaproteobacteria bacterium]
MSKLIDINLYAFGNAAQNVDCEQGAAVLQNALKQTDFAAQLQFHALLQAPARKQQEHALPDVARLSTVLAQSTQQSMLAHRFFITAGGDHSAAIGSWSGVANAIDGDLGLIWFDAHMDSHTRQTTSTDNIHGMPLAILLGQGETALTGILSSTPKLKPENVVLIGIRSYESGEEALLKKLGVKIFYMDDIHKMGMHEVIKQAVAIVTRNTACFGVSIDLDGFDPIDAPGVGTRAPSGIRAAEFLPEFHLIAHHPKLIGADIVEFNPTLDLDHKTEKLAIALCQQFYLRNS